MPIPHLIEQGLAVVIATVTVRFPFLSYDDTTENS